VALFRGFTAGAGAVGGGAEMMAALIFVFSVATLLMFFVSYCRSLMAASSRHTLSREVRDVTISAVVEYFKGVLRAQA